MYLDGLLLQKEPPQDTSVVWGIPNGDSVTLMIHVDGVWRPINGSGSSSSSSDSSSESGSGCDCENNTEEGTSNAIMINAETDFDSLKATITTSTCNKLNIDITDDTTFDITSQEEWMQYKSTYAEEALALGLTTENHGKVVETVHDEDTNFVRMLCEDGFIIKPYGNPIELQEISPRERYAWISYEVIDAFYGTIVPKHVVHNLTDTIVKEDDSGDMYNIYNLASYTPGFTSTDRTSQVTVDEDTTFSIWIGYILDDNTSTFVADNIVLSAVGEEGGEPEGPK